MLLLEALTERIIGAAIAVHRELGPGLLESAYAECLAAEMGSAGIAFAREVKLPICYRGRLLPAAYRLDFLVEDRVILEL
jgi:GxxExxY protein